MYGLFTNRTEYHLAQLHYPEFDYVRRTYLKELANIVDFYNNHVYAVKNNHLLVSLLQHIDIPMHYSVDRYATVAETRAPVVANAFRLTSEISVGKLFNGEFYGGCQEILLFDDSYFNPFYAERAWERISAVKVVMHPKSDLGLLLPNGRTTSTGEGLAIVSINIALLALQYRCFSMRQQTKVDKRSMLGLNHFIHMYVLPNMLYTQLDITLLNRLMNLFYGAPMGEAQVKHPFFVSNYSHRVDTVLQKAIETIQSKAERFDGALRQMPTVVAEDMQDALELPDLAPTRQCQWALMLSRLDIMQFLVDITTDPVTHATNPLGRMEINQLQRILRRMQDEKSFEAVLSGDLLFDTQEKISALLAL